MTAPPFDREDRARAERWWIRMGERLGLADRVQGFFTHARTNADVVDRVRQAGADLSYLLFVLVRYWMPPALPPSGRERVTKSDPDYWIESEQILKAAVERLRELKPLIELLTAPSPLAPPSLERGPSAPVVEVELAKMLEGIAEVAGSYGGPDYTSVVKPFDPVPLRQTQPFKHNKKNSAELWVVFLFREHFKALGYGKDRYWPLIAGVIEAAGIGQPSGQPYLPDELKSWWQKNWPRTYTQFDQHQTTARTAEDAYRYDFEWYQAWMQWQEARERAEGGEGGR